MERVGDEGAENNNVNKNNLAGVDSQIAENEVTEAEQTVYAKQLAWDKTLMKNFVDKIKVEFPDIGPTHRWKALHPTDVTTYERTKEMYQTDFPIPLNELKNNQAVTIVLSAVEKLKIKHPMLSKVDDAATPIQREFVKCCPVRGVKYNTILITTSLGVIFAIMARQSTNNKRILFNN